MDERPAGHKRIRSACAGDSGRSVAELRSRERELADSTQSPRSDLSTWQTFTCLRALLYASGSIAHEGFLMPLGSSWAGGTIQALLRGLERWPGDSGLSSLLAIVALETVGNFATVAQTLNRRHRPDDQRPEKPESAIRTALAGRAGTPVEYRACVSLALDFGRNDDAIWCSTRALEFGMDSTWHLLRLSYLAFRDRQLIEGKQFFDLAVTSAHTPAARAEVGWHLVHRQPGNFGDLRYAATWQMMSRELNDTILALPDSQFPGWVQRRNHGLLVRDWPNSTVRLLKHFNAVIYSGGGFRDCHGVYGGVDSCKSFAQVPWKAEAGILDARSYTVWERSGSELLTLLPIRFTPPSCSTQPGPIDSVQVSFRRWNARAGSWSSVVIPMSFSRPAPEDESTCTRSTLLTLEGNKDRATWHLGVESKDKMWSSETEGESEALSDGSVRLSDLLLGVSRDGIAARLDDQAVLVSPSGRFARQDTLSLYFQIRGGGGIGPGELSIEVLEVCGKQSQAIPRFTLTSEIRLSGTVVAVSRAIGLGRLDSGHYVLRVSVREPGGAAVSRDQPFQVR